MAADDKDKDLDSDNAASSREPSLFVDRDDDSSPGFIDRDDDDAMSDDVADGGGTEPDPGYAAFAAELEDPLADWPSPDASLDDLPEVRMQDRVAGGSREPIQEPLQEPLPDPLSDPAPEQRSSAAYTVDPVIDTAQDPVDEAPSGNAGPNAGDFDEMNFEDDGQPTAPDLVDTDDSLAEPNDDDGLVDELPAAVFDEPGDLPEPPLADDTPVFPELEEQGLVESEDELVDDFLNDLDAPRDEAIDLPDAVTPASTASVALTDTTDPDPLADLADVPPAAMAVDPAMAGQNTDDAIPESLSTAAENSVEVAGSSMFETPEPDSPSTPEPAAPRNRGNATEGGRTERSLPVGMIAVVILALGLLAAGGYGVVQQRSSLQEEIRDLRAQLATTLTAEEAAAEREKQRQIEITNESLNAEVEALTAENADLSNQLQALEAQVADRIAEAEATAEAARQQAAMARKEAEDAAQRAAASAPAAPRSSPAAVSSAGPWFVNFGSYAQQNVADRWAKELTVSEGQVRVFTATAAGKTLYRVRVVGLASQDQAERVATALERQYQLPRLWVGKN